MWHADQDKRPMLLAIAGTIIALLIISGAWSFWHAPTEPQAVDSYRLESGTGSASPAQRSEPALNTAQ